jgi:hypothetical protein
MEGKWDTPVFVVYSFVTVLGGAVETVSPCGRFCILDMTGEGESKYSIL